MDSTEARQILRESWPLWSEKQQAWFMRFTTPPREDFLFGWGAKLLPLSVDSARAGLADLSKQVDPFNRKWKFVGQVILEAAMPYQLAALRQKRNSEWKLPPHEPRRDVQVGSSWELVEKILALEAQGVSYAEASRRVLDHLQETKPDRMLEVFG